MFSEGPGWDDVPCHLSRRDSVNQELAASSKIFEILYFGAIPIISSNEGLISDLENLNAYYISIESLNDIENNSIIYSPVLLDKKYTFDDELNIFKNLLN